MHPDKITEWRAHRPERPGEVFERGTENASEPAVDVKVLRGKIGG
jgi:hypothetical protein